MSLKKLLFLSPVFKTTIWGGSKLKDFNFLIPSETTGEAWVCSGHSNGDCHIPEMNQTLSSFWKSVYNEDFPLLCKFIDAKNDLSIQVHPDDEYAYKNENKSSGKTECWYVLDAEPGTSIVIGHYALNKTQLQQMIQNRQWSEFIREIPVKKGDFFFIEPGTVHAIKGGTLIYEIQQSSDITYRVYDYDRLQDGKPRQLHIQQSIDVIKAPYLNTHAPVNPGKFISDTNTEQLVSCDKFSVWKADVTSALTVNYPENFLIATVIEGNGFADNIPVFKGNTFIIPKDYGPLLLKGKLQIIFCSK